MRPLNIMITGLLTLLTGTTLLAQRERRDTAGIGTVDIISSFKPTLRDPVKIQFSAQPPLPDSIRQRLVYRIPSQELSITYQPGTLKPLAYQADSNRGFQSAQWAKLGYGSLRNPYASLALEIGKRSPVRLYAGHQSASGQRPFQEYSVTSADLLWQVPQGEKGEWLTGLSFDRQACHKYGFDTTRSLPPLDSLRQVFHRVGLQLSYRRKQAARNGFYFEPALAGGLTGDRLGNRDLDLRLQLPIRYRFSEHLSIQVEGLAHWGRIRPDGQKGTNLSVYSLHPALQLQWPRWSVQAGFRPSWDLAGLRMYPDVQVGWVHGSKPWSLRLNWSGQLQRTGYGDRLRVNPWLWMPGEWRNQGVVDRSLRWQYNRRAHWVYELQAGYATLQDAFLFINDTTALGDGKSFQTVYADRIQNLYAKAHITYRQADRWRVRAEMTWNNYHGIRGGEEAWGLLPFEWRLNAMYRLPNKIRVQADLYSWFAPFYLTKSGQPSRTDGAFDLNLGAEIPVTRYISGWLQFNNLLNQTYSRWSQYPVYGFHFVGGVVFSLDKKIL